MPSSSVCVIYTGGTIGMAPSNGGSLAPQDGFLNLELARIPQLSATDMPHWELVELPTLLDSANMTPRDWNTIADAIATRYDHYDGFVVLHGTDTMAYTASALSFMLKDLRKPVIITGSQLPLYRTRSDGRNNLIDAITIAGSGDVPEVCLYFHGKLMRGNRATKCSSTEFAAFDSPNYAPLAIASTSIQYDRPRIRPASFKKFRQHAITEDNVTILRMHPGFPSTVINHILQPPLKGLVLECFGQGTGPDNDSALLEALEEASSRGIVIVAVSQCYHGEVVLRNYATGASFHKIGVVGGRDMTAEAALTKLMYLLSRNMSPEEIRPLMQESLVGELTPLA